VTASCSSASTAKASALSPALHAIRNTGDETQMRKELAAAVGRPVLHSSTEDVRLSDIENMRLVKMRTPAPVHAASSRSAGIRSDIVTLARTAIERDAAWDGHFLRSNLGEKAGQESPRLRCIGFVLDVSVNGPIAASVSSVSMGLLLRGTFWRQIAYGIILRSPTFICCNHTIVRIHREL
jgi:hypothetical protein